MKIGGTEATGSSQSQVPLSQPHTLSLPALGCPAAAERSGDQALIFGVFYCSVVFFYLFFLECNLPYLFLCAVACFHQCWTVLCVLALQKGPPSSSQSRGRWRRGSGWRKRFNCPCQGQRRLPAFCINKQKNIFFLPDTCLVSSHIWAVVVCSSE